jgi:hypothetical protein
VRNFREENEQLILNRIIKKLLKNFENRTQNILIYLLYLKKSIYPSKGPKLEIFGSRVFTQIRPVWVGDLGTRQKNPTMGWFMLEIANLYFLAL